MTRTPSTDGRSGARRRFVSGALAVAVLLGPAFVKASARQAAPEASREPGLQAPAPQVTVSEEHGVYSVIAQFEAPDSPALVLAVLTDYEQIPRFMPGVETSIVRERSDDGVVLEQEAVSRLFLFSRRVHLVLDVTEAGNTIRFRDACGRSFSHYEGAWRLSARDGRTLIRYELSARPSFAVPDVFLRRVLRRDAKLMIERLLLEITTRQASTSAVGGTPFAPMLSDRYHEKESV